MVTFSAANKIACILCTLRGGARIVRNYEGGVSPNSMKLYKGGGGVKKAEFWPYVLYGSLQSLAQVWRQGRKSIQKQTQINQVVKQKQRKWKGYPCYYHSSCEWQAYNHSSLKHSDLWKIGVSSCSQVSNKSTAGNKSAVGIQVNTKNCQLVKFQQ